MPTPKKGARLGGSAKQQAHMLSNLAASLIEHGAIKTTDAKAKVLRPYIEKIITKAKSGTVADRRAAPFGRGRDHRHPPVAAGRPPYGRPPTRSSRSTANPTSWSTPRR